MTGQLLTVMLVLLGAVGLFVSDRVRLDVTALLVVLALTLTGLLTPAQALAGFADPLVIMIAALFVVSGALVQSGVADSFGRALGRVAGRGEVRMIVLVMLATGLLSAFMSSTGTVAVMLPIVMAMAWRAGVNPSKLLIPTAYAALVGGMLTLIATPPNLVASQVLQGAGREPFGFFAFTPFGLAMLGVSTLFMALVGRHLLPARASAAPGEGVDDPRESMEVVMERFGLPTSLGRLTLPPGSALVGRTLREVRWPERLGVQLLAVDTEPEVAGTARSRRHLGRSKRVGPDTTFSAYDRLLLQGSPEALEAVAASAGAAVRPVVGSDGEGAGDPRVAGGFDGNAGATGGSGAGLVPANLGFAEVLLPPRSAWIGKTLAELRFRERYGVQVVAVQRGAERVAAGRGEKRLASLRLRFGDTLLLQGPVKAVADLKRERNDAVVLSEAGEAPQAPRRHKAPIVLVVLGAMLVTMTVGWVAPVVAVLLAVMALVLTGSISMEEAYRSIQWESVVLIAGMLPLATALELAGGVTYLADFVVGLLGGQAPLVLLAGVYLVTTTLGQLMSNTATAVLIAPIALRAALDLGVAPEPVMMMVALAAASSFCTPMASPVNTLVVGPGKYRFGDFVRVGLPMQLLMLIVGLVLVPLLFRL